MSNESRGQGGESAESTVELPLGWIALVLPARAWLVVASGTLSNSS
jgi:hypothetical protein